MPLQIGRVTLSIDTNALASVAAPSARGPLVVVGPCADGPINTPVPVSSQRVLTDTFLRGPAVEAAAYALRYVTPRILFMRTDPDTGTDGAYGTIGVEGDDFNVVADTVILPQDDLEVIVTFTEGGTVGVTGIEYTVSYDGGRKTSGPFELGTALFINLDTPYGAGKFNLYPDETAFVTLVTEIRNDFLAHVVLTAGGVHGLADPTVYTITTPTNYATSLTALGELIAAMATHVVLTAGTVHGAADTAAQTALAALTAPTTIYEGLQVVNNLYTIHNTHIALTAGGVHGAADTANAITGDMVGIIIADGDAFDCVTIAPRWNIDKLVEALEVLRDTSLTFGLIEIVGPFATLGEIQAVDGAIIDMRTKVKYRRAIGHFRHRTEGETLLAYSQAFGTLVASADCDTLALCPSVYVASAINKGAIYVRSYSWFAAPRQARIPENISAMDMDGFGKAPAMLIRDSAGDVLPRAVDDEYQELFTPLRGFAPVTIPKRPDTEVYGGQSATLAAEDSDTSTLDVAQVLDKAAELAYLPLRRRLGKNLLPGPTPTEFEPQEKKRIQDQVSVEVFAGMNGTARSVRVVLDDTLIIVSPTLKKATGKVLVGIFDKIVEFDFEVAVDANQ